MTFARSLGITLDSLPIELGGTAAAAWKARADGLYAAWPSERAGLRVSNQVFDPAVMLRATDRILGAIAAHPPVLPCHGVTHTIRVLSHALRIARRDELDPTDSWRLLLAAASHDIGRLLLHRDGDLRHADVSAVILEDLRDELNLAPEIFLPARHAVLMHSAKRVDLRPIRPRVIDDVRSADKLDALDEIGFVRAILYQGANQKIALAPTVGSRATVLYGWWKNIESIEAVSVSHRERRLISAARARSRRIGQQITLFSGPPERLGATFLAVTRLVEPDANRAAIAQTLERLEQLPQAIQANWTGLLTAVLVEIQRLEARRLSDLSLVQDGPRADLAPLASLVLRWSRRAERTGRDLVV